MIYNSLDILPIKVFYKILNTNDFSLLSDENITQEELKDVWESLYQEYKELDPNNDSDKNLSLSKRIEELGAKYKSVIIALDCLIIKKNEALIQMLLGYGYRLSKETFELDLQRIDRESKVLLTKIEELKRKLSKESESQEKKISIDNVLASYSVITGIDFDYNSISVTKFFAIKHQVELKIKASEKNGK